MRAQEFIKEAKQATAREVLKYINRTHHEPFQPGENMHAAVLAHPRWELQRVPLLNLNIPDQEYDDVDYHDNPPESDPYNRVMTVDPAHAGEISQHLVDRYPIVIDADRYIIDGNHRAWAAKYLLNRDYIQAWVPVAKQGVAEEFSKPIFYVSSYDDFNTAFEVEMVIDNKNAGFFSYQYFPKTNDVENDVDIHSDQFRGRGYGKILLLKAIETAQKHNLPFKVDRNGVTPEQRNVYRSLLADRIIRINPDKTITLTGKNTQDISEDSFNGIDISMTKEEDEIMVRASAGGKQLGSVLFVEYDGVLTPQDLEVDERFRGQGIARTMYDYVKSKGYRIRRSGQQTDAGAGFWGKHRPDSNVWEQDVAESLLNESAIFLNPNTVIVGQEHGRPLNLSPETMKRVQAIAAKHGAWYEGNGADRVYTKGQIDNYVGSFDDNVAKTASPNDPKWLYVLFANVDANNRIRRVGIDPNDTIFNRLLITAKDNSFQRIGFTAQALKKFLSMASEGNVDFVRMSQQPATQQNLTRFLKTGEALMWPSNWEQYPNRAGKIAKAATVDARDQYLASRKSGVYVVGSGHLKAVQQITGKQGVTEAQAAKTGIYQTDVLGAKAYHAKCMEPKCGWESKRYDRIKQAQAAAEKHAKSHFKQGVTEGSVQDSFVQRLGRKLQQSGYTQTGTGTWSQGPDGRYVAITPLPDGQYGWELRRINRRGKWYSGVDTAKAVVVIFKEFDIFSKHPVDESLAEGKISVRSSPGKGNGLFATKLIKAGEVITRSKFVPIDDQDWNLIKNTTPVKLYGFKLGDQHALQPGPFKFQFKDPKEKELWNKTKFKDLSLSGFMFVNGADSPNEVNSKEKFSGNTAEMIATRDIQPGEEIIKQYNVPTTGVAEGGMKDLHIDLQDQQWDAIVGYVINGLKKNMDIGRIELNLYKYAGQEMFDVDQELQDRGFRDIADLADHIRQHNGRYVPPTDFNLGKGVAEGLLAEETLDDYLMSLKNRGAKIIGRGNNAMVFTNPEDDRTVIKVMHQPDPAYLAYLRQSIKHPNNPWLPRVLDVTSQAFDTANPRSSTTAWIIVLEKLRPASSAEVKNAVDTVLATVDPRYLGRQPVDAYRTFDDIKKLWPTIAQHSSDADIQVVAKFLSQFAPQDIDVSNTNVMMRGLQLVFADPVLS